MIEAADTIAAIVTPPGRGGVGIVRLSGPAVPIAAERLLGRCPQPRHAELLTFRDASGNALDQGIALYFPAPHSYTGEHVLELQGHGGSVVVDRLLAAALAVGARPARPGEFTERAFLNGKLDLAQAEAVADLIDSASGQAATLALRSLEGAFSAEVHALADAIVALRTYVEAALDFSDEEIDFLTEGAVAARLEGILQSVAAVRSAACQGAILREGMHVVIAGQPNVGKSSLLNTLAGRDSAIVTDLPGTTRDLLREQILVDGMPLHVIDTAGLRDTAEPVEREGIRRAWSAIEGADRVLLVVEDATGITAAEQAILDRLPPELPRTVLRNKIDLTGAAPGETAGPHGPEVRLSTRTGAGLQALRDHLKNSMGWRGGEGLFMARRRHLDALDRAAIHLAHGAANLADAQAGELLAEELRLAHRDLGEITGEFATEDLLERIFADFCIGK